MVIAHSPETAGLALFESVESQALPIEEVSLGGKLERISRIVASRLGNAVSEAEIAGDSEISSTDGVEGRSVASSVLGPWLDGVSPERAFSLAERAVYANDRVMSTLVRHLVEHVVIDHELRQAAADARRRASDELRSIPLSMVDFVNRLMACGVVADDVRDMSRKRLSAVVGAIREIDGDEALEYVPEDLPVSSWSDVVGEDAMAASDQDGGLPDAPSDGLIGALSGEEELGSADGVPHIAQPAPVDLFDMVQPAYFPSSDSGDADRDEPATRTVPEDASATRKPGDGALVGAIAPVIPASGPTAVAVIDPVPFALSAEASESDQSAPSAPLPQGLWDVIDVSHTAYRIEERAIASDEDVAAAQMRLPPDRSMVRFAMPKVIEMSFAEGAELEGNRVLAERFLMKYCLRTKMEMTEVERRLWLFLLFEIVTPSAEHQLGRDGFFDGVMMPGPKGSSRVRRIVAVDRERLVDALDGVALAGPAVHRR